nr:hypothetical protein [Streptomyces sp. NRRL S-350]
MGKATGYSASAVSRLETAERPATAHYWVRWLPGRRPSPSARAPRWASPPQA